MRGGVELVILAGRVVLQMDVDVVVDSARLLGFEIGERHDAVADVEIVDGQRGVRRTGVFRAQSGEVPGIVGFADHFNGGAVQHQRGDLYPFTQQRHQARLHHDRLGCGERSRVADGRILAY